FIVSAQDAGITFTLTATGGLSGLTATATFTDGGQGCPPGNKGAAFVQNVTPNGTGCAVWDQDGSGVVHWDVQQGQSYKVTLVNVTDCGNGGTDATTQVEVKNTTLGNQSLTANRVSDGVYTFDVTMPANACNTFPIFYCIGGSCGDLHP